MITVKLQGVNIDRFLKKESKIQTIKNINRISHTEIEFDIKRIKLKKLVARCKKMCYNLQVKKYQGIDKFYNLIKKHLGFCIGIIFVIVFFLISSNFILKIDIYGNESISRYLIEEALIENNVFIGSKIKNNYNDIEKLLKENFEKISQISIAQKGSYLVLNIKEKISSEIQQDNYDIVAVCDGVINSIIVTQGTQIKKEGDSFKAGDILVKGEFVSLNGEIKKCKAIANIVFVEYKTIYTKFKEVDYEKIRTGETLTINDISFLNIKSKLEKLPDFEFYEVEEKEIYLFDKLFLPIKINTKIFHEIELKEIVRNFEEEKEKIILESENQLREICFDKNITNIHTNIIEMEEGYLIVSTAEILNVI